MRSSRPQGLKASGERDLDALTMALAGQKGASAVVATDHAPLVQSCAEALGKGSCEQVP